MRNRIRQLGLALFAVMILMQSAMALESAPSTSAGAVMLMEADSGTVLYEANADAQMLIASTTKIMTALVVLEQCSPDEMVTVSASNTAVEGSSMYLQPGKAYTVEELLYGLLLVSGNDAALALAEHTAGSVEAFAALMNEKAAKIGCKNTAFVNPHGLNADGHYSSARDLAMIMAEAMKNEEFRMITGTKNYTLGTQTYINHNRLLWSCDGVIGGKTGYTIAAGRTLVSCAERDGMQLICVTLGDPDDWKDHTALYDWGFSNYQHLQFSANETYAQLPVISGTSSEVAVTLAEDCGLVLPASAEYSMILELPAFVFAGLHRGQYAGWLVVTSAGEEIGRAKLIYAEDAAIDENVALTGWERTGRLWRLAAR
ncbi:MAG: D-alanyl-D-alanine carboxypeptidase family protein [Oscillospiraceae bacterium]|jgi:D-alanyl-D-alanine carboxypeptidase (penicillin-binding protein 5/6)